MRRALVWSLIFWSVVSAAFAQSAAPADVSRAGMAPERLARISTRMREFVDAGTIAGAVTLVARHGVVVSLEAVGYQYLETRTPMRTDSIFQIRSMTKPITAVGVMMLLEEGRLLLSDPVAKYVPEFRATKASRPITIRDLLTHTSGIGEAPERKEPSATLAESVALLSQVPLAFAPGSKFAYSNEGFETLGRVIEVASGQSFGAFVARRILQPLGMRDSFFFSSPEKCDRIASHYESHAGNLRRFKGSLNPEWQTADGCRAFETTVRYPGPSWGMFSTASDMAVFYQMMLHGGAHKGVRILSTASVEIMTAVQTGDLRDARSWGYGLGWFVQPPGKRLGFLSPGTYSHEGLRGTFGWADPQTDTIGILMIQLEPGWENQYAVRDTFIAMTYAAIVGG